MFKKHTQKADYFCHPDQGNAVLGWALNHTALTRKRILRYTMFYCFLIFFLTK